MGNCCFEQIVVLIVQLNELGAISFDCYVKFQKLVQL